MIKGICSSTELYDSQDLSISLLFIRQSKKRTLTREKFSRDVNSASRATAAAPKAFSR